MKEGEVNHGKQQCSFKGEIRLAEMTVTRDERRFGFIVHPRSMPELRKMAFFHTVPIFPFGSQHFIKSQCLRRKVVKPIFSFPSIVSSQNKSCAGKVFCIFLMPDQILNLQATAVDLIEVACEKLRDWGPEMIGLGGLTGAIGSRGKEIAQRVNTPVTTGNSLTVYSSLAVFERLQRDFDISPAARKIVIVGFPGSISLAIARALAKRGFNLLLVNRRKTPFLDHLTSELRESYRAEIEVTEDLHQALSEARVVFTATSTGRIIDSDHLPAGSIIIDIAQPRDVIETRKKRNDVLVIDGGVVTLPVRSPNQRRFANWETNDVPACLAETMILALERVMFKKG